MAGPLDLLEQIGDAVDAHARPELSEIASHHLEWDGMPGLSAARQTAAECVIDDVTERAAGPACLRLQLGGNVIIERQRSAHILMLI